MHTATSRYSIDDAIIFIASSARHKSAGGPFALSSRHGHSTRIGPVRHRGPAAPVAMLSEPGTPLGPPPAQVEVDELVRRVEALESGVEAHRA